MTSLHACAGKIAFAEYSSAADAAGRKTRRHSAAMQPYRCPSCRCWHLGTHVAGNHIAARIKKQRAEA